MHTITTTTLGETVANNINRYLDRLGWDYQDLADHTGLAWAQIVSWRADASDMTVPELEVVATGLGLSPIDLTKESDYFVGGDVPTFVTLMQAAASLGVKPWHLVERVEAGTLRAVRHDGVVLVEVAGLRTETGE